MQASERPIKKTFLTIFKIMLWLLHPYKPLTTINTKTSKASQMSRTSLPCTNILFVYCRALVKNRNVICHVEQLYQSTLVSNNNTLQGISC